MLFRFWAKLGIIFEPPSEILKKMIFVPKKAGISADFVILRPNSQNDGKKRLSLQLLFEYT